MQHLYGRFASQTVIRDARKILDWAFPGGRALTFKKTPVTLNEEEEAPKDGEALIREARERQLIEKTLNEMLFDYEQYWPYRTFPEASAAAAAGRLMHPGKCWRVLFMGYEDATMEYQWVLYVAIIPDEDPDDYFELSKLGM